MVEWVRKEQSGADSILNTYGIIPKDILTLERASKTSILPHVPNT